MKHLDTCKTCMMTPPGGGVTPDLTGVIEGVFLGLKFSIPGFFEV